MATTYAPLGGYGEVKIRAAGTITAGMFVKLGTNGVVAATDGSGCFGVSANTATSGDDIIVYTRGIFKVSCATGFNPDQGDKVYLASSTTIDGGSAGNMSVGTTIMSDPASGGTAYIILTPSEVTSSAHA